jgi:predicted transcriptional regulator
MPSPGNNVRIPDDLLQRARILAEAEGRTPDDPAATALERYLQMRQNARDLQDLAFWGERHARARGFKPEDVDRAIAEIRRES